MALIFHRRRNRRRSQRPSRPHGEHHPPDAAIAALPPASVSPEQLPPVAEVADPAADEVVLENGELRLVFTAVGGRLKGAKVILGKDGALSQELVPVPKDGEADKDRVLPLGLRFSKAYLGDALDQRRWTPEPGADGKSVAFSIEVPGQAKIVKRFALADDSHLNADRRFVHEHRRGEPEGGRARP